MQANAINQRAAALRAAIAQHEALGMVTCANALRLRLAALLLS